MLTGRQWAALEPLIEMCRLPAKVAPQNLRQTMSTIVWRHQNGSQIAGGAGGDGTWWKAAQTFMRWSRLGVWERLLLLVQKGRIEVGMTFLDGTNIRAHPKVAGAPRKTTRLYNGTSVKWRAGLGVPLAPLCGASVSFAA